PLSQRMRKTGASSVWLFTRIPRGAETDTFTVTSSPVPAVQPPTARIPSTARTAPFRQFHPLIHDCFPLFMAHHPFRLRRSHVSFRYASNWVGNLRRKNETSTTVEPNQCRENATNDVASFPDLRAPP